MSLVWDNFRRGGSEKLAMLALADWCNDEGDRLHPSISTISKKINASESQTRRIIHGFIDEGYLTVVGNHQGGNPGQSRQYKLNVKKLSTTSMDATPTVYDTPSVHDTPSADATPSMDAHRPLAPMRETPSVHDTQDVSKPLIEPPNTKADKPPEFDPIDYLKSRGVPERVAKDWLKVRKGKKAASTETAFRLISIEIEKAGISFQTAIERCCANSWSGFKASWPANGSRDGLNQSQRRKTTSEIRAETMAGLRGTDNRKEQNNERDITGESRRID
jgi:hypothetical protein